MGILQVGNRAYIFWGLLLLKGLQINRWITLTVIGFSGGIAYQLPYLRYTYHDAMLASFGLDNTQLGMLMSLFGIVAMFLYVPSGMLADRYSHRKLMAASMVLSGLVGFVFATYPPFWLCLVIEMTWALTTALLLSSTMIKATSMLGTRVEQGKLLGWLEGISGAGGMVVAFFTMWVFAQLGARAQDLATVINMYSVLNVLLGIACWFLVPDGKVERAKNGTVYKDVMRVLSLPTTWYIAILIFSVYTVFAVLSYTQPYLSSVLGMSTVAAGYIAILRQQVFRALCGPIGGIITDKTSWKSPTKIMIVTSIFTTIALLVLIVIPPSNSVLLLTVGLLLLCSGMVYINRGLYFATLGEIKTPVEISGTVIGVASVIGYLPDSFVYILIGYWQDAYPGVVGYQYTFTYGVVVQAIGIIAGYKLYKEIKKQEKVDQLTEQTIIPVEDATC